MIKIKTGTSESLDATELVITIQCIRKVDISVGGGAKEKEERYWCNLLIDKLREQVTGGGWRLWNYENIKVEYTP